MLSYTMITYKYSIQAFQWARNTLPAHCRSFSLMNGTKFGFEMSPYIKPSIDCISLERSIRSGCRFIIGNTGTTIRQYEHIAEISSMDEVDCDSLVIGSTVSSQTSYSSEVANVVSIFKGRPLDLIAVPIEWTELKNVIVQLRTLHPSSSVGVNLGVQVLSEGDIEKHLRIMEHLCEEGLLDVVVCASNAFTVPGALRVVEWTVSKGIPMVSSDVLRAHPRSPGMLLPPSACPSVNRLPACSIDTAIDGLKKNMDSCIHIEQRFLEKIKNEQQSIPDLHMPHLLLGLTLMNSQSKISFCEEWEYLKENDVSPNFEKACTALESSGFEAAKEFMSLYKPMRRNLIRAFDCALDARQEALCDSLKKDAIDFVSKNNGDTKQYASLTLYEGLCQAWMDVGAAHVTLSGIEVLSDVWDERLQNKNSQDAKSYITGAADALVAYEFHKNIQQ